MNTRILSIISAVLVLAAFFLSGCKTAAPAKEDGQMIMPSTTVIKGEEFTAFAENSRYRLLINKADAAICVENKNTGLKWSSIPEDSAPQADNSLLEIEYLTAEGTLASMNSFSDSVKKGQYLIKPVQQGAKIEFTLGNVQEKLICPPAISVDTYESLIKKITSRFDKVIITSNYWKVYINEISDKSTKAELLKKYPALKVQPLYVIRSSNLSLTVKRDIDRILTSAGYTQQDYERDSAYAGFTEEDRFPVFNIPIYITLSEKGLEVRIPVEDRRISWGKADAAVGS